MLALLSVTPIWFEGKHVLQKTGKTFMVWICQTSCSALSLLKPHIQFFKELLSSLKMPTYFTPCVSYSFRHLIKLESKNYLVSRKTFPTSMSFLEIENYTLPNANVFQTFIFQKELHKTGKNFHISILILEIFRYGSLSQSVDSDYIKIPTGLLKMPLCGSQYKFTKFKSLLDLYSVILQKELQAYSSYSISFNYYLNAFRHLNMFSRHLELAMSKIEFIIILPNNENRVLSQCKVPPLFKSEHSSHSPPISNCQCIL